MKRVNIIPRQNWKEKIKNQGFVYYEGYYTEEAAYEFSRYEIDKIELATTHIFEMCMKTLEYILNDVKHLQKFHIPIKFYEVIKRSYYEDHISFYGRFDLVYNGFDIKVLEFNADTPTSLIEGSIIQWYWLQDFENGKYDQFNSIHDKLIAHLETCKVHLEGDKLFFTSISDSDEDFMTVKYLEDCANQAGIATEYLPIPEISVSSQGEFCTFDGEPIQDIFKLYPYEWMFNEEFADYIISNFDKTFWIEPLYKAILSNKMFMVYLYQLFSSSPYVLKCYSDSPSGMTNYVQKPLLSREGANVTIMKQGNILEKSDGEYGEEGYIYQEYFEIPKHQGKTPVIGSWVIGGESAGISIREADNLITNNTSKFVPHYFR